MTDISTRLDPPDLVVEVDVVGDAVMELSYDLAEVFDVESEDAEVEVLEATDTGVVLEIDGETEHVDLRPIMEES